MATQYIIERDDEPNLRFTGTIVAEASSRTLRGPGQNRWVEMTLYRTERGTWVAERVGRTCWQGERDTHEAVSTKLASNVVDFLGMSRAAKELYEAAGFDATEYVE